MLEIQSVTVSYGGNRAVNAVDLAVEAGQIVLVMGANGAGKSSLMRAIGGLERVASGRISLMGEEITHISATRRVARGLAQVLERRGSFTGMTVQENLELGAYLRSGRAHAAEVKKDLDFVYHLFPRLIERRRLQAGSLSGGEQQMLVIGRALMSKPRLLLLDEPSLGLAPLVIGEIASALQMLNRQYGLTMLITEQNVSLGKETAHRTVVLQRGRIVDAVGQDNMFELYLDAR